MEPDHLTIYDVARAAWNALFFYFGGEARIASIDLPLPSNLLHEALLTLGAIHESPNYTITRSAIFQSFSYAQGKSIAIPFPYVPSTSAAGLVHPMRPKKPSSIKPIYSRYIPHLEAYYKLDVLTSNDLSIMHTWLNDERVDVFWQEAGTLEVHEEFVRGRIEDKHTVAVIGSYVPISKEGDLKEAEPATYTEVSRNFF